VTRRTRFLLAALAGLLEAAAFPLVVPQLSLRQLDPAGHLEWIAWVGLVPAVVALASAGGALEALLLGLVAGLAAFFAAIYWVNHAMTAFGGLSMGLALVALSLLVLYMAAHWALVFWASFTVRRRLGWPPWVHLPPIWVAGELLRNYLFTGFPWANLGYSQARHAELAQLAAVTGVYGIAWLVVLVNAVLAGWWLARRGEGQRPWAGSAVAAVALAAAWAHGVAHLATVRRETEAAPRLRVGIVQANVSQSVKNQGRLFADLILGRLWPLTAEADRRGAALVAWPEAAWPWSVPPDLRSFDRLAPGVTPVSGSHLLLGSSTVRWQLGADGRRTPELQNSVFLLGPDLRVLDRYAKHHLVPFGEYVPLRRWLPFLRTVVPNLASAVPGGRLVPLAFEAQGRRVTLAPMICFDAIFPEIARAFARQDPDLLVNPTNDAWYGYSSGPYQFLAMVQMRAVETGRAVVRPAYSGVSALVLPSGEVAPGALELGPVDPELAPDADEPARLLVVDAPLLRGRTLYTTLGDLFAWTCSAAAVALVGAALTRRPGPAAGGRQENRTPWPHPRRNG
jgi:apolipoprotein N-acyltransferase